MDFRTQDQCHFWRNQVTLEMFQDYFRNSFTNGICNVLARVECSEMQSFGRAWGTQLPDRISVGVLCFSFFFLVRFSANRSGSHKKTHFLIKPVNGFPEHSSRTTTSWKKKKKQAEGGWTSDQDAFQLRCFRHVPSGTGSGA